MTNKEYRERMVRHGELLCIPVDALPANAEQIFEGTQYIVAHSESGHHSHKDGLPLAELSKCRFNERGIMRTHEQPIPKGFFEGRTAAEYGCRGIDYGEMGMLLSEGKIRLASTLGKYFNEWDTLLLAYANYKTDNGSKMEDLFQEWGIDEHHHRWFNDSRSRVRIENFYTGIY